MAGTIKHRFQSAVADAGEAGMLGPDEWNDSLVASGGTNGDLFLRNTVAADGWSLLASAAASQVLVSVGAGSAPSWSATPTLTSLTLSGLTANSFLYSGAAGALTTTAAPTNGQLLIGSTGAAPALGTIAGTANRVTVTNGAGTITLSGPQDLATSSAVQFGSLGLGIVPTTTLDVVASGVTQAHFGGVATHGLYLRGASSVTHYNWLIGEQVNVGAALEITPSTAVGGTTFSTPVAVFLQDGRVGFGTGAAIPGAQLHVTQAVDQVLVKLVGAAGQGNPLLQVLDNATVRFQIDPNGNANVLNGGELRVQHSVPIFRLWTGVASLTTLSSDGTHTYLGSETATGKLNFRVNSSVDVMSITKDGSWNLNAVGPHAIGGAANTSYQLNLLGTFTASAAAAAAVLNVDTTLNAVAGQSAYGMRFTPTIATASSGNHLILASMILGALSVISGAATVTNAATFVVSGPPTVTVSGARYAAWIQGGNTRFGDGSQMINVAMGRSAVINSTVILTGGSASSAAYDLTAASGTLDGMLWKPSMQMTGASTAHNAVTVQAISMADGVARTVTNQRGIYVAAGAKDVNTTVTTAYGIYVEAPTIGGTNVGLYNAGTSTLVGIVTASAAVNAGTTVRTGGYTVATLPAGVQGDRAFVTDALAPVFLGALTGGGAVVTPVFHNGTAWVAN